MCIIPVCGSLAAQALSHVRFAVDKHPTVNHFTRVGIPWPSSPYLLYTRSVFHSGSGARATLHAAPRRGAAHGRVQLHCAT